jgi:hypothetical protein
VTIEKVATFAADQGDEPLVGVGPFDVGGSAGNLQPGARNGLSQTRELTRMISLRSLAARVRRAPPR